MKGKSEVPTREQNTGKVPYGSKRPKKRRNKKNLILYYIIFGVIIVATVIILSTTVFFKLEAVNITGESIYTSEEINAVVDVNEGDNLFAIDVFEIEETILATFPAIETVNVRRRLPSSIEISVTPCVKMAELEQDGEYYLISEGFKVMGMRSEIPTSETIVIYGFEANEITFGQKITSVDPNKEETLNEILTALEENEFTEITDINIEDRLNIVLVFDNRIPIELGSSYDIDYKIQIIKQTINELVEDDFVGKLTMVGSLFIQKIEGEFDQFGREPNQIIIG